MKLFAINILLAFAWAALSGEITVTSILLGFIIAYILLYSVFHKGAKDPDAAQSYLKRLPKVIGFFFYYVFEILRSNVIVACDILRPQFRMKPGVIALPMDAKTDLEITVLANLISMTPGTLSLDVSEDRKVLYVHAMFIQDPDQLREEIKSGLERRVLEILR